MPVSRRKYEQLLADYERIREQRDEAQRNVRAMQTATRTAAGQFTAADDELLRVRLAKLADEIRFARRIVRLVRIVARLRGEVAAAERRTARVQAAYDNAVGLDNPTLDLGAHWQTRRADKPRTEVAS
ncbi:hypothetical protein CG717_16350 [Streptomyces sp. CB02613]|uniref:hypothetical protein n=1 Tax=Streptomyces sp. CB02613 TaxID=2020328 RepID=UPI000C275EBA|nr:hypothetical protein [Streptomyces sp. CB02613]PJN31335.1 hypothetical protein CG717_16350 [Streptomyces sp. CB02613]